MLKVFSSVFWGWHTLVLIVLAGLWLTFQSGFFQIRYAKSWLKTALGGDNKTEGRGISSFQALTAALGGSIGTGNIVGVAVAITAGGPGAVLWMCVSAIFGMMTLFAENLLSALYPQSRGAMGYIEKVKKIGKPLAIMYALGSFLSSLAMGNMVQMNAAASAAVQFGVPREISGVLFAFLLFFVAVGGLKTAVKISEKLVPFMTVLFFGAAVVVLWVFRANIPAAATAIFEGAFSLKAGVGGVAGMLIAAKTGISRGVFTNEAGLGSSTFAYDEVTSLTPVQKGYMGIFQVFADTIVMCTVTGFCILCVPSSAGLAGAQLSFYPFEAAMGEWGAGIISLCTALFAAATTVTWCCYGREGLFYLTKGKGAIFFALIYALFAFVGCVVPLDFAFLLGDAFNGFMAFPNLAAIFYFSDKVIAAVRKENKAKVHKHREKIREKLTGT